jgi:hypothetical protein
MMDEREILVDGSRRHHSAPPPVCVATTKDAMTPQPDTIVGPHDCAPAIRVPATPRNRG